MKAAFIRWIQNITFAGLAIISSMPHGLKGETKPIDVWVTLPPQAYVVERIGGEAITVRILVEAGSSPATYAPSPAEVAALARSDIFFGIGVPTEKRMLNRMASVLATVRVVPHEEWGLDEIASGTTKDHPQACHHEEKDPHVWLDPEQMRAFAAHVVDVLTKQRPAESEAIAQRGAKLIGELERLGLDIRTRLAPYEGRSFFINHGSLGHFAARYGLEQRVLVKAGSTPSTRQIIEMVREARREGISAVLAQVQFERSGADILARSLGIPVIEVDPLARNYKANLERITEALLQTFEENPGVAQ